MNKFEIKCPNCKEGKHLQTPLKNYPKELEFYKCDVCGSVWENEKIISLKELLKPEEVTLNQIDESLKEMVKREFYDAEWMGGHINKLRAEIVQEYASFCIECDREKMPLITFDDYCKL